MRYHVWKNIHELGLLSMSLENKIVFGGHVFLILSNKSFDS